MEKEMKVIIIGGGVAAVSAAEAVVENNKKAQVTIISKEEYLPYYRIKLTEKIYEEIPLEKMNIKNKDWYSDRNINLILNQEVEEIVAENKYVLTKSGEKLSYDSLIIASGAKGFVPPFENFNLKNVKVIRELKETEEIINGMDKIEKVVVIGGGVLGLEAAEGFKLNGKDVTVLEIMPRILPRQLDEKGSFLLEEIIDKSGIKMLKGVQVAGFEGNDSVKKVILKDGRKIDADLVIISAGIKPNLIQIEGAKLNIEKGIVVNEKMESSVNGIYACGDVAEFDNRIIGLWPVAREQGKIAGTNSCGGELEFKSQDYPLTFEGMGTKLISMGTVDSSCCELLEDYNKEKYSYRKLYFVEGILKGFILLGDTTNSVFLIKALKEGKNRVEVLNKIFSN